MSGTRLRGALQRALAVGRDEHGVAGLVERVVQQRRGCRARRRRSARRRRRCGQRQRHAVSGVIGAALRSACHRVELELARQRAQARDEGGAVRRRRPRSRRAGARCRASSRGCTSSSSARSCGAGGSAQSPARQRPAAPARRAARRATSARAARPSQSSSSATRTGLTMKSAARDADVVVEPLVEGVGRDDRHRRVARAARRAVARIVSQPSMPGIARSIRIASGRAPARSSARHSSPDAGLQQLEAERLQHG